MTVTKIVDFHCSNLLFALLNPKFPWFIKSNHVKSSIFFSYTVSPPFFRLEIPSFPPRNLQASPPPGPCTARAPGTAPPSHRFEPPATPDLCRAATLHWQSLRTNGGHWENWVCLKMVSTPKKTMVLLIIIPTKWLFHWEYTPFSDIPNWPGWRKPWRKTDKNDAT